VEKGDDTRVTPENTHQMPETEIKKSLSSDNSSGVHPDVLTYLTKINQGHTLAYGYDEYTEAAQRKFREIFDGECETYFVFNGTGANVLAVRCTCDSIHSVMCSSESHLYEDECSAAEKLTGCKLIPVEPEAGKLTITKLESVFSKFRFDEHQAIPRLLSITQPTEVGTVYTVEETQNLAEWAHKNGMLFHIDGARIANAAVSLGKDFKAITKDCGADVLSFGGTKNGLIFAEALVFFNKNAAHNIKYHRKQLMQLASKHRFLAGQFLAYFENNLWKTNAENANNMARYLAEKVREIPKVKIKYPVEANGVFAVIPPDWFPELTQHTSFYPWNLNEGLMRWMCSFDTRKEEIDAFVEKIKSLAYAYE
jgi:threonine aldolase